MIDWIEQIRLLAPSAILEIAVLSILFYYLILFLKGTRGAAVLTGLVVLLLALMAVTQFFRLDTLNWILQRISGFLAIVCVIIFQPEIRRALAQLGKQHVLIGSGRERDVIDQLVRSVLHLADRKIGALIAVEREIGIRNIRETGTAINSDVSSELIASIFYPNTPLHDGGVVIHEDQILAAGCFFPLSQRDELSKSLGTRHRAAIGITEEADCVVLVVSEETGSISVAYKGRLSRGVDEERLRRFLSTILVRRRPRKSRLSRVQEELNLTPEGVAKTESLTAEEAV